MVSTCPLIYHVVLAALHRKMVITQHGLQRMKGNARNILLDLLLDQYTKPPEDIAITADVLNSVGCKKEAEILTCKFDLYSLLMNLLELLTIKFWSCRVGQLVV